MKGLLVFYVNFPVDAENNIKEILTEAKEFNKEWINKIHEVGYQIMFVPVQGESSRVEKVDFDLPFPRYVLPHIDIVANEKTMKEIEESAKEELD